MNHANQRRRSGLVQKKTPGDTGSSFQPDMERIVWRVHFRSQPETVYTALATPAGRRAFWAESAEEENGIIRFVVPGDLDSTGGILETISNRRFVTEYFGWTVAFDMTSAGSAGGTDLTMTCCGVPDAQRTEVIAGWVSVLLAMKAAVDFGVDLRNHDRERTWWQGFADN